MTALMDSTTVCVPLSPGPLPSGDGTFQTSTPCAEGSGRGTMASSKHPDCTTVKVSGSGIRTMSRWRSCPGPIPEARDPKLKLRTPSPGPTPLPRPPLRDTDPPLRPPPPADRPRAEQRFENSVAPSPYAPPCSGSTNGGSADGLSRTGESAQTTALFSGRDSAAPNSTVWMRMFSACRPLIAHHGH